MPFIELSLHLIIGSRCTPPQVPLNGDNVGDNGGDNPPGDDNPPPQDSDAPAGSEDEGEARNNNENGTNADGNSWFPGMSWLQQPPPPQQDDQEDSNEPQPEPSYFSAQYNQPMSYPRTGNVFNCTNTFPVLSPGPAGLRYPKVTCNPGYNRQPSLMPLGTVNQPGSNRGMMGLHLPRLDPTGDKNVPMFVPVKRPFADKKTAPHPVLFGISCGDESSTAGNFRGSGRMESSALAGPSSTPSRSRKRSSDHLQEGNGALIHRPIIVQPKKLKKDTDNDKAKPSGGPPKPIFKLSNPDMFTHPEITILNNVVDYQNHLTMKNLVVGSKEHGYVLFLGKHDFFPALSENGEIDLSHHVKFSHGGVDLASLPAAIIQGPKYVELWKLDRARFGAAFARGNEPVSDPELEGYITTLQNRFNGSHSQYDANEHQGTWTFLSDLNGYGARGTFPGDSGSDGDDVESISSDSEDDGSNGGGHVNP